MNRRERIEDINESLIAAMGGWQRDIWTAMPGIVTSFDPVAMTCEVQPTIKFKVTNPALHTYKSTTMVKDPSGEFAWDQFPILLDCPVQFPGGGGVTLTFPIKPGDEVLVIFASRCIDAWWKLGGIQNQAAVRMHDMSDGFVIPQVRSQVRRFTVSGSAAQLRTDNGSSFIELEASTGNVTVNTIGNAAVTASGNASITSPSITLTGDVTIAGRLTQTGGATSHFSGTVTDGTGKSLGSHVHSGVQPGSGNTGGPV